MRENIVLHDAEVEVEDAEELAFNEGDVPPAKRPGVRRPVRRFRRRVVRVLNCTSEEAPVKARMEHTFAAAMRAPRKTRWYAHSSRSMRSCPRARRR